MRWLVKGLANPPSSVVCDRLWPQTTLAGHGVQPTGDGPTMKGGDSEADTRSVYCGPSYGEARGRPWPGRGPGRQDRPQIVFRESTTRPSRD